MSEDPPNWEYQTASDLSLGGLDRMRSESREMGLTGAAIHGIARLMTRALLRCFVRIHSEGLENIPKEMPFVLVANHSSHLDALLLADALPARYTGKFFSLAAADYFFDKPGKTLFATRWVNALPLRRGSASAKALKTLRQRLELGDCIYIVFPEGTRSRDGTPASFKPGVGMLVAELSVPVVPCYLDGCHRVWPPDRKLPRRGSVTIRIGEPETFESLSNEKSGWKEISNRLQSRVETLSHSTD